jgi:hypothetical protein
MDGSVHMGLDVTTPRYVVGKVPPYTVDWPFNMQLTPGG